jgi:hypothetical protein
MDAINMEKASVGHWQQAAQQTLPTRVQGNVLRGPRR